MFRLLKKLLGLGPKRGIPGLSWVPAEDGKDARSGAAVTGDGPPESDDSMVGTTLGDCQLLRKLAEDTTGANYLGRREGLEVPVTIQVLPENLEKANPEFADEFRRAAEPLVALNHPNVAQLYEVGHEEGRTYMVLEFFEGTNLEGLVVEEESLEVGLSLGIAEQILEALSAAHPAGLAHLDVTPGDVLLPRTEGPADRLPEVKLDGLWKAVLYRSFKAGLGGTGDMRRDGAHTVPSGVTRDCHYMSPEVADGSEVDGRADIYSVGCLLYQMLCGRRPYVGKGFVQTVVQHLQAPVPDPCELRPELSPERSSIVRKMMAKKPEDRFQSADEALAALRGLS